MAGFHFSSDSNRLSCFYTCCNSILRQEINRIRHKAQGRDGDSVQLRPNEWEFTFPKACNGARDLNPTGKIAVISLLLLLSALQCAATILQQHTWKSENNTTRKPQIKLGGGIIHWNIKSCTTIFIYCRSSVKTDLNLGLSYSSVWHLGVSKHYILRDIRTIIIIEHCHYQENWQIICHLIES